MKELLIIGFLILNLNLFSQVNVIQKFDNGQIKQCGYRDKSGLLDSIWYSYNENGKLIQKAFYSHGIKVGVWETYYDNGLIMYKIPYKNGIKSGVAYQFDETGQILNTKQY